MIYPDLKEMLRIFTISLTVKLYCVPLKDKLHSVNVVIVLYYCCNGMVYLWLKQQYVHLLKIYEKDNISCTV